ncbi:glycosyltransferase family 10 domain-containing protein [Jannaschia ovalis]|uniref:Glycosyltransferase family 10 n=1 Tax=Jannaschia ovalis TaxID=3038773 RepID=A0ABY8L7R7_9RHOB|nr:glycosyltransferase family 10 [Jannaschia sp. GRR-S6-38]WGH77411.1 glycosyltransferase family 10 [Jannaschia sp. GRR-S6-38]
MIKAHVFATYGPMLAKQFPGKRMVWDDVQFTIGLDVPSDTDVLIVHIRASYSIPTSLPRERTVFIAGEPDVIHPYSAGFLNQFGLVVSPTEKPLTTTKWQENYGSMWFVGVPFGDGASHEDSLGFDHWAAMDSPPAGKIDKISVVTSDKTSTDYHRRRLKFLEALKQLIPDRLEIFGRGVRSIGDKAEALLPYKYHLALENGGGADTWTEKLSDPLLTWTFPFYAGCSNPERYIPEGSIRMLDLDDPEGAARDMVADMESGRWQAALDDLAEARQRILYRYSLAPLMARAARAAFEAPVADPGQRMLIRSERSLWPEPGTRGSIPQWALRSFLLKLDPKIELRMHGLVEVNERLKAERRKRRFARQEGRGG